MTTASLVIGLFRLLLELVHLYALVLLVACVFSFLFAFGVLDNRNRLVYNVGEFLYRITEPVLRPVRRILPPFGAMDLSPLVVLLVLQYVVPLVLEWIAHMILSALPPSAF